MTLFVRSGRLFSKLTVLIDFVRRVNVANLLVPLFYYCVDCHLLLRIFWWIFKRRLYLFFSFRHFFINGNGNGCHYFSKVVGFVEIKGFLLSLVWFTQLILETVRIFKFVSMSFSLFACGYRTFFIECHSLLLLETRRISGPVK